MRKFRATVEVEVEVTVNDERVIDRVVNNEDDWRGSFYDLFTAEDVVGHLAYNYVVNSVERVGRLDGWADVEAPDAVTFDSINYDTYATEASSVQGSASQEDES